MKSRPECIVCLFTQALNTVKAVSDDPAVQLEVLRRLMSRVAGATLEQTPARLSRPAYEVVAEVTGVSDPYRELKRESNRLALQMLPLLTSEVVRAPDPLEAALHAAAAGNVIDLGIGGHVFDIERDVTAMMRQPFAISDLHAFRNELGPGKKILYLGDNAGEIVFDRLLVQEILRTGTRVVYTVKSGPMINDATMEDARDSGMSELVEVIETGSDHIGVNWDAVSGAFRQAFETADAVLSKGQGNFESCSDIPGNIYFLLKAKCRVVAEELGAAEGDVVFKRRG
jgi:uncharacterized protein with ATP-grasp and redox domains